MLFRVYVEDEKEIVELSNKEVEDLLSFYKNYDKIIKSIYREDDSSIVKIAIDNYALGEDSVEIKNLMKGEVYYLNYINEKDEEYYFKVLGIYNDHYRYGYILKTITVYFERNKLLSIGIEYYTLDSFIKDDMIIYFDKRFPKTIKTELLNFINSIEDE